MNIYRTTLLTFSLIFTNFTTAWARGVNITGHPATDFTILMIGSSIVIFFLWLWLWSRRKKTKS